MNGTNFNVQFYIYTHYLLVNTNKKVTLFNFNVNVEGFGPKHMPTKRYKEHSSTITKPPQKKKANGS